MASTAPRPRPRRRLLLPRATLGRAVAGLVGPLLVGTMLAAPAAADGDLPPGRRIVDHRVRAGETVTGLAVRYHAWTDELIARNQLGPSADIRAGEHLEIPVVLAALPHHRTRHHRATHRTSGHTTGHRPGHGSGHPAAVAPRHRPDAGRHGADPTRTTVRRTVARTAARRGVDPQLALAVAWQESGWQMDRRSGAGAIGAMQVLPATGAWMSLYEGHRLRLHHLADNAAAGVRLLDVLGGQAGSQRRAVGAYYQGLGAVRDHGLYPDTRDYVENVLAIRHRLEAGRPPA